MTKGGSFKRAVRRQARQTGRMYTDTLASMSLDKSSASVRPPQAITTVQVPEVTSVIAGQRRR